MTSQHVKSTKNYDEWQSRNVHFWQTVITTTGEEKAKFTLYGNTAAQGTIKGVDSQTNRFVVRQLETPSGLYEKAVLRGDDVQAIEIPHCDWHVGTRSAGLVRLTVLGIPFTSA
ncbi:hypothetical protein BDB00DRAFT_870634 [Zychaea mexicana]|uniref:uncharacterized protein n=1 Tax=Zychaea mexicana TaxID=64656 RepID=UPI0022FEF0B9|nr:uncharacterized protein BDB00DRAFT_870634 [Zychaea mexicana]KAI9495179.1 hypothetical protein BDB00DRAFT_870634 [Zychaea mexicana]